MPLSRRLWYLLKYPLDYHPLFSQLSFARNRVDPRTVWLGMGGLAVAFLFSSPNLLLLAVMLMPLGYAALNVSINGAIWSVNVAQTIARERAQRTYDLICLLPTGGITTNWVILSEAVHYRQVLQRSYSDMLTMVQIMVILPCVILVGTLADPNPVTRTSSLTALVMIVLLMGILVADYVQSVITAALIGCVVGNQAQSVGAARLWSLVCVAGVQAGFYALLVIGLFALPALYRLPGFEMFIPRLILTVGLVVAYLCLRELLVRWLWARLNDDLNSDSETSLKWIHAVMFHEKVR